MGAGPAAAIGRLCERLYPERQILLRSRGEVRFVTLGRPSQITLSVIAMGLIGWLGYATSGLYLQLNIVAGKDARIAEMAGAYDQLSADMLAVEDRYKTITSDLENNQRLLGEVLHHRASLQRVRQDLMRELGQTRGQRDLALSRGKRLEQRLSRLENNLRQTLGRTNRLQGNLAKVSDALAESRSAHDQAVRNQISLAANLDNTTAKLRGLEDVEQNLKTTLGDREQTVARLTDQRDSALTTNLHLGSRIEELEGRLDQLKVSQRELMQNIHRRTNLNIAELELVVRTTGVNLERLLDRFDGRRRGMGGPLVLSEEAMAHANEWSGYELPTFENSLGRLESRLARWSALNEILERLPISPPVDEFHVSSRFGKRRDPFTKRRAFHGGVDLAGYWRAKIYATSPGVVRYVGWKGPYGRLVEIDHGYGIKTRYGHLSKILVKRGQKVGFRQKIGLMGSTGRSTGSHVHYEIVFDGKPQNPENFLKAGKYVFKG
ncbi:MAG: peptidoglycan DD-metalloendopeptidase family protein [Alphaproteobacteria bacterium]|jgi:murein DD-endopeptidase MepM/ murein hydrolase activator NlpD|nr:peptidoglycan DD-metalloendopeptidase family protein [Alphaproteobacteria bacterium]MDP6566764.1 peptidoglycan DD-metalloendopeptidase family protein [Alphaproteobacteria bacterium]MDP6812974.1 peptidoglycan DD-metalloendopeptidase family protein [Alphaproteobacteria bacterium]